MSRRSVIEMTLEERTRFLDSATKACLSTVDAAGYPHVVAMGFLARDGVILMTSYAKAQKVRNIERNPKVGVMVETGADYADFRGVVIRGSCEIIPDPALAASVIRASAAKEGQELEPESGALASVAKRVVLRITPQRWVTWDHRKLAGRY